MKGQLRWKTEEKTDKIRRLLRERMAEQIEKFNFKADQTWHDLCI